MRILILSANTGGGHNSTAGAIAEQFKIRGVEAEIADSLSYISEKVSDFISWGHSYVYRKLPRLFGIGYRFEEKHTPRFIYNRCAKGAPNLFQKLQQGGYDGVICVHVFAGLMMTAVRERYKLHLPTYFVATDYTCSPGVADLYADGYFIPHALLLEEFTRAGLDAKKIHATGIPISQEFYRLEEKAQARTTLGLPQDKRVVLLSCGSMGAGHLDRRALKLFQDLPDDTVLCVLCGNNRKTYEKLKGHICERLHVVSFTENVCTYMSASDLYITKPGGLMTTEALAKRLPMVLVTAVPGLETRNYEFLLKQGVACGATDWKQVTQQVLHLLQNASQMMDLKAGIDAFLPMNAASALCEQILSK